MIGMSWTSRDWERALLGTFRRGPPGHRDAGRRTEKILWSYKRISCDERVKNGGIGRIDKQTLVPARIIGASGTSGRSDIYWGRGGLETNENILSTLQALVESTCHLPADNRLGTFQMFLQVPGHT